MKEDLTDIMEKKVKPMIEQTTRKFMGVSVHELNKSLLDKIEKPKLHFNISTSTPFKKAKKLFKKEFFSSLIETRYGNISEVAKIADVDRRSVHRTVKELGIDVKKLRAELLNPDHYVQMGMRDAFRGVLDTYRDVFHPKKMAELYENIDRLTKDISKELPDMRITLREAEEEWERQYLSAAMQENNNNVTITSRKIRLRYETLHRKLKALGLI